MKKAFAITAKRDSCVSPKKLLGELILLSVSKEQRVTPAALNIKII